MKQSKKIKKVFTEVLLIVPMFILLLTGVVSASQWAIEYEGVHYQRETGSSIQQTTDYGYIVAGSIQYFSTDWDDIWILKLNPDGNITWQKTYDSGGTDNVYSILQTEDGGYVVVGDAYFFGSSDFWVLKLNLDGTVAWQKTYGSSNSEYASSIQQTSDGGYIVVGNVYLGTSDLGVSNYDIRVLKLNTDGTITWQKTYGGSYFDFADSIGQTSDGGYIVVGNTTSSGPGNVWVLKLDMNGNVLWQKTYGGSGYDSGASIQQTSDGGYIVAGHTNSFGAGSWDFWVFKLDINGNVLWQKTYGGSSNDYDASIQQTSDGGYIVAGLTYSSNYEDILLLKLTTDGSISWQKTYDTGGRDYIRFIQETIDGGFVLVGWNECPEYSDSADLMIMKIDANGEIPGCNIMGSFDADVTNTSAIITNTSVVPQESSVVPSDTNVLPQDTLAETNVICGVSPPAIGYNPTNFIFIATQGGSNPPDQTLNITNTGGGTLNWSVSDNATWLSLSPTSGTNSGTVTVSVNIAGLSADTRGAIITIAATGATNSPVTIPVTLMIKPVVECRLVPDDTTIPRGGTLGGLQAFVTNNTDNTISVLAATKVTLPNGSWYPSSGFLYGPISVSLDPYQSKSGRLSHTIPLTAPLGIYIYHGYVGNYGVGNYSECQFDFTVTQ